MPAKTLTVAFKRASIGSGAVLLLMSCTGCIIVRTGAPTVLEVKSADDGSHVSTFGMKKVTWSGTDNDFLVVGEGRHPREHETYAFSINEPFYGMFSRHLLLTPVGQQGKETLYKAQFWLTPDVIFPRSSENADRSKLWYYYEGSLASHPGKFFGNRTFSVKSMRIVPDDPAAPALELSGRIVAKRVSVEKLQHELDDLPREGDHTRTAAD